MKDVSEAASEVTKLAARDAKAKSMLASLIFGKYLGYIQKMAMTKDMWNVLKKYICQEDLGKADGKEPNRSSIINLQPSTT